MKLFIYWTCLLFMSLAALVVVYSWWRGIGGYTGREALGLTMMAAGMAVSGP